MTLRQARFITWSVVIISGIYTFPVMGLAKLGRLLVTLEGRIKIFNQRFWGSKSFLQDAVRVSALAEIEKRKESVRRKRGRATEIK